MMEVPDSLCVVLIGSQAPLKGLSCAVPPRGPSCQVLVSKKGRGGAVVQAVIHFWTTGEPCYIIFLAWFLGNFTGIANLCLSSEKLLHLARGIVVPCHPCPYLETEQDTSSWGSREELDLLMEVHR